MGPRTGEHGHRETTKGNIDFACLSRALKKIDCQGFVAAEPGFRYTLDPDSAVEQTHALLG